MEKEKMDPIKAKYNQKVRFFKKIQMNFNDFKEKLKNNKSLSEDKDALISMFVEILIYGILGGMASTLFGFNFNLINIISIGSFLWLLENKLTLIITSILGSIKLIEIKR